jgi:hypothetical protein
MIDLICCVGLHWILKYGTILNKPRHFVCKIKLLHELFKCSLCLGFWCGLIVGGWKLALASAACCWFFDNINNMIQSVEIKLDNHD